MGKILEIIDEECANIYLKTIDNKEYVYQLEFIDHIALEIVKFLKEGLSKNKRISINISEYCSRKKIQLAIKDNYLFLNKIQVEGLLIDIAKQIVKDIEENISDWALYFYGNLHTAEEWKERDWEKFHIKELEQELNELKIIIQ